MFGPDETARPAQMIVTITGHVLLSIIDGQEGPALLRPSIALVRRLYQVGFYPTL